MHVATKVPVKRTYIHTVRVRPAVSKVIVPKYSLHDVVQTSYYVGKGITLFTMFYCTLNWWHYKRLREDHEDEDDKR
jgi:hypothetical protein